MIIIIIIIIIFFKNKIQNLIHRFKKNRLFTDSRIWILKIYTLLYILLVYERELSQNDYLKTTNNNYKKHQKVNKEVTTI